MTSVLPEEMKHKLMSDGPAKEEARPFLGFSRENLSISHCDLEREFNGSRLRPSRNTILSALALIVAFLCLGLESWKLGCTLTNAREIEQLKRDVEDLKHQYLEQNLMDELKAFEEQLYTEESSYEDLGETADYDDDDDGSASHEYSGDYHTPLAYGARPSDFPEMTSSEAPSNKMIVDLLTALCRVETKRRQELERSSSQRDFLSNDTTSTEYTASALKSEEKSVKAKRSVNNNVASTTDHSTDTLSYQRDERHFTRTIVSREHPDVSGDVETNSTLFWDRHPPKKYHSSARPETSSPHRGQSSEEILRSDRRARERMETGRIAWRNSRHNATGNRTELRKSVQHFEAVARQFRRGLTRRHLRAPRQVYAIHYGADSSLFSAKDEHTGNGRARHSSGIFKAWRPSSWVADLGMNRHFTLTSDGKLTVHEPGLYLAYAQIHYLDEHDENGFHLLVNGRPILQCMVYSPGVGHKSRSCFSAQVTVLQAGDHLILKDVGSARYTLFQHDKSFFGLVKLGESRQQQRHQSMHQ